MPFLLALVCDYVLQETIHSLNTEFHNGLRQKISGLLLVKLLGEMWLLRGNVFT